MYKVEAAGATFSRPLVLHITNYYLHILWRSNSSVGRVMAFRSRTVRFVGSSPGKCRETIFFIFFLFFCFFYPKHQFFCFFILFLFYFLFAFCFFFVFLLFNNYFLALCYLCWRTIIVTLHYSIFALNIKNQSMKYFKNKHSSYTKTKYPRSISI